ncbi:uncharacterized protein LOC110990402 [Acanthaster planci]|uniref:Uncharacterized protein LOC110990402 n=1 Tax=Acanthaster planci TaxID=133434 RepID=A0A8B8A001_ACAPL|nr:uncharacterized protein LOC110990402 [Acanthaster planci]
MTDWNEEELDGDVHNLLDLHATWNSEGKFLKSKQLIRLLEMVYHFIIGGTWITGPGAESTLLHATQRIAVNRTCLSPPELSCQPIKVPYDRPDDASGRSSINIGSCCYSSHSTWTRSLIIPKGEYSLHIREYSP